MSEALYPIAVEVNGMKRTGHVTASRVMRTSCPTTTPPLSISAFQLTPKS